MCALGMPHQLDPAPLFGGASLFLFFRRLLSIFSKYLAFSFFLVPVSEVIRVESVSVRVCVCCVHVSVDVHACMRLCVGASPIPDRQNARFHGTDWISRSIK